MSYFDNCKIEILEQTLQLIDMSDEEYFTSPLYKDYISNSKLKLINPLEGGSPEKFLNPPKEDYNSSLEFGSCIHQLILQPNEFGLIDYQDKPSGKLGLFIEKVFENRSKYHMPIYKAIEFASKDANYYYGKLTNKIIRNALEKGFIYYKDLFLNNIIPEMPKGMVPIVVSSQTFKSVYNCLMAYEFNSPIKDILSRKGILRPIQSLNEKAFFVDFKVTFPDGNETTLHFKGKLDNFMIDEENKEIILNDLKTTSHGVDFFMGYKEFNQETQSYTGYLGSFQKLHYYRQLAAYMYILQYYYKHLKDYKYYANILAIESKEPYKSAVFRINNSYIQRGIREFKELMCRAAYIKMHE